MSDVTKTEVATTIIIADLTPSDPPAIVTVKRAVNSEGSARHLTQKVMVPNLVLAHRLFAEVQRGDEITLTLTTTWTANSYETQLTDFVLPVKLEDNAHLVTGHFAEALS